MPASKDYIQLVIHLLSRTNGHTPIVNQELEQYLESYVNYKQDN